MESRNLSNAKDFLTPEQRSDLMSRVRAKDTEPERIIRSALHKRGLRFRKHRKDLPGKPDIVFVSAKVVVFVDGDFWHGYEFDKWKEDLSSFWRKKISDNIKRDQRNFKRLRKTGWRVIRIWEHDIEKHLDIVVDEIAAVVKDQKQSDFEV
jgi:DNA mismatch endonuclease (patch repair protein)